MSATNNSQEHAVHYDEEIHRGADPEAMGDMGYRPPADKLPYAMTKRLGGQVVAGETATNVPPGHEGPNIDTVMKTMRQKPRPPASEKGGKRGKGGNKKPADRPKSRLSGRTRMFVDGRGSDPDLM